MLGTYNPTNYSYFKWVAADSTNFGPVHALVGIALLIAWIVYLRASFLSLGWLGLALWGALHMAGGLVPTPGEAALYNTWLLPFLRYDQLTHAIGFGFAGLAVWSYFRHDLRRGVAGTALAWFGGVGIGGLNEMIEFLLTRIVAETNVGGFENTGWDLVANFVGASAAALWVRRRAGRVG